MSAPNLEDRQDETFSHTFRTLLDLTELSQDAVLRVVTAGLRQLSAEGLLQVENEARSLRETRQNEEVKRAA